MNNSKSKKKTSRWTVPLASPLTHSSTYSYMCLHLITLSLVHSPRFTLPLAQLS
jgi:hypothetical protein